VNKAEIIKMIALLDLTALNIDDTAMSVEKLCQAAKTPIGHVAAVCVYSRFLPIVTNKLSASNIKVATVVNFPSGQATKDEVLAEIDAALLQGADEIDMVIPYQQCLLGELKSALDLVASAKDRCANASLKVILETGAFANAQLLAKLSYAVLVAGADFLKTSTGKIPIGATLPAAKILLSAIAEFYRKNGTWRGFKVSGGVREIATAKQFMLLAEKICGSGYTQAKTFRIGASSLLNNLLAVFDK